jgi:hypothetical protein
LIEIGLLVLEKKILQKKIRVFLLFCVYLHLEIRNPHHFNNLEFLPPKNNLWQIWLKLAQWFWRRSQNVKVYRQTDGQTDRRTTDKGSLELSAQVS